MNWCYLHPAFVVMTIVIGLLAYFQGKHGHKLKADDEARGTKWRRIHIGIGVVFFLSLLNAFG